MHRLALLLVFACGCSSEATRGAIEGEVLFANGRPVPSGKIRFISLEEKAGPATFTDIVDGKYRLDAAKGPALGKNRIEITAFRKSAKKVPVQDGPPGEMQEVDEQYLPADVNVNSQIFVQIAPGDNKKDIRLP